MLTSTSTTCTARTSAASKLAARRSKGTMSDARKDERKAFSRAVRRAGKVSVTAAAAEYEDEIDFDLDTRVEIERLECEYDM